MVRRILFIVVCALALGPASSFGAGAAWPLPDLGALPGWKQIEDLKAYNHDTLYEYIDGDAETYFGYGFSALGVCKFAREGGKAAVTLNLYEMKDTLAAFGIYANGRSADVKYADVGAQGYYAENALDFWKGRYYCRVIGEGEPKGLQDAVLAFGRGMAAKIEGESAEPAQSKLLPREGQVPNSLKYQPQNVLGQGFISNAFSADYDLAGASMQLVVAQCKDEAEAGKALVGLRDYVKGSGAVSEQSLNLFYGNDPYYKNILAVAVGPYLVCILRAPDRPSAQKLVSAFLANLKR